MIGSSVVPGLPNRCVMPSSFSNARNAERPVMRFMKVLPFPRPLTCGIETTWPISHDEIKQARSWLPCADGSAPLSYCIVSLCILGLAGMPEVGRRRVAQKYGIWEDILARAHFPWFAGIVFLIGNVDPSLAAPRDRFFWLSQINRASAVMVVERGIVPKPLGAKIFDAINRVDAAADQPGAVRSGDYLKVERDLMAVGGPDISRLHSGRSRQDIGATIQRLITRDDF